MKTLYVFFASIITLSFSVSSYSSENRDSGQSFPGIDINRIEKILSSPESDEQYQAALSLKEMISSKATNSKDVADAARPACQSLFPPKLFYNSAGVVGVSPLDSKGLIMIPLANNTVNPEYICNSAINANWTSLGIVKSRAPRQDCISDLDNNEYGGDIPLQFQMSSLMTTEVDFPSAALAVL